MKVKNEKNTWAPMIGIWRLDKVSGTQSRASVALFYLPGKRYKKPYVLDSAAGIKLLNAFCAVTTEQDLVKFLNSNGSIELKEPNSDDPNHLENWLKPLHRRVRAETPIFPRKEIQQSDIDRLLKFAASLKWLREFAEIIKSCDSQPEKLLKYASLTEFPRNKLMKSFTANQILQFAPRELYNSRERINQPTYEVPVDWCCFKLPDLIRKRAKFVNECARHFVQQILSNLLSELAPIVTSNFKISYEPRTPSQAMCIALLEEASRIAITKMCECKRPGCSKIIPLNGKNKKNAHTKYLTKACRQSVFDEKKRVSKLLEGSV